MEAAPAPLREGTVLCECEAFRLVDSKFKPLSHTSGLVRRRAACVGGHKQTPAV